MSEKQVKYMLEAAIETLAKIDELPEGLLNGDEAAKQIASQLALAIVQIAAYWYAREDVMQVSLGLALLSTKHLAEQIVSVEGPKFEGKQQ